LLAKKEENLEGRAVAFEWARLEIRGLGVARILLDSVRKTY
jgi:hypothetical protein